MQTLDLVLMALAGGALALQESSAPAVVAPYEALLAHLAQAYPEIDPTMVTARPTSQARRDLLHAELAETAAPRDAHLRELARQAISAIAGAGQGAVAASGLDLPRIQAAGVALTNVNAERISIEKVETHLHLDSGERVNEAALRRAYLTWVRDGANLLSLAGIDPTVAAGAAEARLQLGAVYTALLTAGQATMDETRMAPASMMDRAETERRPLSAVAQLNAHDRLVLLGDPGSGKSTFVNFVALCLAGEALADPVYNVALLTAPLPMEEDGGSEEKKPQPQPWDFGALLPVRVVLRDFAARGLPEPGQKATADHLLAFIRRELPPSLVDFGAVLQRLLLEAPTLLLLDGLDEVPAAETRRVQIKQAVEAFASLHPQCRILVTSRTYAYQEQDWRLHNFTPTLLAPFSKGQIGVFIDRWYAHIAVLRHQDAAAMAGNAVLLRHAVFNSPRLYELAERPLLLTLMASLHAWRGGTLPDRREELYADAVDLLLERWESGRIVRDNAGNVLAIQPSLAEWLKVDREKVLALLSRLAFTAHEGQPKPVGTADIHEDDLVQGLLAVSRNPDVKPLRLVEFLSQRAGLLMPRGVGVYTFPHRTFQEYLAAWHLTEDDFPAKLANLARTDPNRWREVALLAGAKAGKGASYALWSLADELCFRTPEEAAYGPEDAWGAHLTAQALLENNMIEGATGRNAARVERVRTNLVFLLRSPDLPPVERALAGRHLAKLGDPRPAVMSLAGMAFCYIPAGPFVMGEDDEAYKHNVPYAYWIGRFPVTNAQFRPFVAADGYRTQRYWPEAEEHGSWNAEGFLSRYERERRQAPRTFAEPFNLPNHPVVGVSWYEALAFTRWLTEQAHAAGWIDRVWQVTLPNEPEWEKAARGGRQIPLEPWLTALDGIPTASRALKLLDNPQPDRRYPWGESIEPDRANYDASNIDTTAAAGCFARGVSPYGVEELSGTAWEWTRNVHAGYPYVADDGREEFGREADAWRVLRGGAFFDNGTFVRCARRYRNYPDFADHYLGFRVVLSPLS